MAKVLTSWMRSTLRKPAKCSLDYLLLDSSYTMVDIKEISQQGMYGVQFIS